MKLTPGLIRSDDACVKFYSALSADITHYRLRDWVGNQMFDETCSTVMCLAGTMKVASV